jgi:S-adenosylmethionine-diacylglycerol 3-amino-3-carboxypropyl transferase
MSARSVRERAAWDFIRYASVWEDADLLLRGLAPVAEGRRLLSIASAGDNALALLTLDPEEVVAVDLNPAQIACTELRLAAFRHLDDDDALLSFLGVLSSTKRAATYAALRQLLPTPSRNFWDARPELIEQGVIHVGKFERYLRGFRRWLLPMVHGPLTLRSLTRGRTLEERREFYRSTWDNRRWRLLFRAFFSRRVMGRLGRDPAFFTHVDEAVPVSERILERTRHALTEIPTHSNPYLVYIMTGNFAPGALPAYLRPENTGRIRGRLDRVTPLLGRADAAAGPFAGFNLSDIFEYMSEDEYRVAYRELAAQGEPGARIAYWNLLAPRGAPAELSAVRPLRAEAEALHAVDRAWFYGAFHLDEVIP